MYRIENAVRFLGSRIENESFLPAEASRFPRWDKDEYYWIDFCGCLGQDPDRWLGNGNSDPVDG